jgi:hypothetical protein
MTGLHQFLPVGLLGFQAPAFLFAIANIQQHVPGVVKWTV